MKKQPIHSKESTHSKENVIAKEEIMNNPLKLVVVVLLVLNLILASYVAFFKKDALWLETLKAGGSENFALVEKLYNSESFKNQQAQSLAQVLESMDGAAANNTATGNVAAVDNTGSADAANTDVPTLDKATMESIQKDVYIKGKKDARFVIFEYSDLLCPFCKRHHNDQTLQKVQEKYPNDVALIFKNMPLVQLHPTAFLGAEGLECAGSLGGRDVFYQYLDKAFALDAFDKENVVGLAKELGLSENRFSKCIETAQFKTKIDGILEEARTVFGIGGTPGNVILDRDTGKYVIVNGAYPFEKFDEEIQNLMK